MVLRTAFHKVSSHQTRDLEHLAESNSIPQNRPTIFHQSHIATILQMFLPLKLSAALSAIPFVSDRWGVEVRWFHDKSSQNLSNSNELSVKTTFGFSDGSRNFRKLFSVSCDVFVLHRYDWIHWVSKSGTTIECRWLCLDSLPSLRILWSAVLKSPNFSARGTVSPVRLLQGDLVILVRLRVQVLLHLVVLCEILQPGMPLLQFAVTPSWLRAFDRSKEVDRSCGSDVEDEIVVELDDSPGTTNGKKISVLQKVWSTFWARRGSWPLGHSYV